MRSQLACFGCASTEATPVFEFNGLVLLEAMQHSPLARYDYALCHRCGLVYATSRPQGDGLRFLYSRFDEFLGRTEETMEGTGTLSAAARADVLQRVSRGWLVSEEEIAGDWLPEMLAFRVSEAYHADIIAALVPLRGARILELRSFDGHMLRQFKTYYGAAEVMAMAMSEQQRLIIEQLQDVPAQVMDFDTMALPHGRFDLVIARHMLTHALDSERFWDGLTQAVTPGGWLYLYLENDDAVMFSRSKNLFGEMKCFHFQNFDLPCLARVLRLHGFEPRFIRHPRAGKSEMVCLARRQAAVFEPLGGLALTQRRDMYAQWRALSVLSAPPAVRRGFAGELDQLDNLARTSGHVKRDREGRMMPVKLRIMHEDGYTKLNERGGGSQA